jgi:transcriptional regulator with XRE-family HTH domain
MNVSDLRNFGSEMRRLRTKRGLSHYDVARATDLSPSTIQYLEEGRSLPYSNDKIRHIESAIGVQPDYLVELAKRYRFAMADFLSAYGPEVQALVSAFKIYSSSEISRIIQATIELYEREKRKGGVKEMATTKTGSRTGSKAQTKTKAAAKAKQAPAKRQTKTTTPKRSR